MMAPKTPKSQKAIPPPTPYDGSENSEKSKCQDGDLPHILFCPAISISINLTYFIYIILQDKYS